MNLDLHYNNYTIYDLYYRDLKNSKGILPDQLKNRIVTLRCITIKFLHLLDIKKSLTPDTDRDDDIRREVGIAEFYSDERIADAINSTKRVYPPNNVEVSNFYIYLQNRMQWRKLVTFSSLYRDFWKDVFKDMTVEQQAKHMLAISYSRILCEYYVKDDNNKTIIPTEWVMRFKYGKKVVNYIKYMRRSDVDEHDTNIILDTERYLKIYDQSLIDKCTRILINRNHMGGYVYELPHKRLLKKLKSFIIGGINNIGGFEMNQKQFLGTIGVSIAFVVILVLGFMCTYRIGPGFAGVIYNANGGVQEDTLSQGWHMVLPWQSVIEYPVSTETVSYSKGSGDKDSKDTSINVNTKDGKQVNVDVNYTYRMDQNLLPQIFTNFRGRKYTEIEDTIMKNAMYQAVNEVTSQYNLMELVSDKRPEVNNKIFNKYKDALAGDGIILETFNLSDIKPDAATEQAIQNVVNAQNALAQSKIEKEKAEVEAEKLRVAAKGKADATLIEAEGQAAANEKLRQSLSPEVIQYNQIQKWNGTLPQYMLGENTGVFITPQ